MTPIDKDEEPTRPVRMPKMPCSPEIERITIGKVASFTDLHAGMCKDGNEAMCLAVAMIAFGADLIQQMVGTDNAVRALQAQSHLVFDPNMKVN